MYHTLVFHRINIFISDGEKHMHMELGLQSGIKFQ